MKKLFLLRHAQTLPAAFGGQKDSERKLTPKGQADAMALGASMIKRHLVPDLMLCSTAERTQETLRIVKHAFPRETTTHFLPLLYDASREDLLHLIQNTTNTTENLMIVGHNPTMHEFCALLAQNAPESIKNKIMLGYPPGTLTVVDFPTCTAWAKITPELAQVTLYLTPQDYNAPKHPAR